MTEVSEDFNTLVLKSDSGQIWKMTDPWVGHFPGILIRDLSRIPRIELKSSLWLDLSGN